MTIENDGALRARSVVLCEFTVLGRYEDPEGGWGALALSTRAGWSANCRGLQAHLGMEKGPTLRLALPII